MFNPHTSVRSLAFRFVSCGHPRRVDRRQILEKLFEEEQGLSGTKLHDVPRLMKQGKPVELSELQRSLRPDELVLEYALGEPGSHCLVIDNKTIRTIPLTSGSRIESLVDSYLAQVRAKKKTTGVAKELYSILLGTLRPDVSKTRLIVVPDGKLHLLPFDALINEKGDYVLKSHVVSYAPSATVLHLLKSQPTNRTTKCASLGNRRRAIWWGINLIANNSSRGKATSSPVRGLYDLTGEKLPLLPGTAEEVQTIAAFAGAHSIVLAGPKATETSFRSQPLEKVRVLHLAVHGISSSMAPERAALVLGRGANDQDDGLLQAREIAEMDLAAELVTLSACDTGAGRLVGQEGIVNLVRSFLYAGARSVVASIWAADDAFTTSLMKRFYANLAKGIDRGAALQQAKLDLIEQFGDDSVPFFWAGFTMIGDGSKQINFSE